MPNRTCNTARLIKRERLLSVLNDGAWHATRELARRVGHTFGGAVSQLRRLGHDIARRPHPHGRHQHQYQLTTYERD